MRCAIRSSWWLMLVALLFLVPSGFAGTVNLQINNPPSNNVLDGIYVGAYSATDTQTHAPTQIICDDFKDDSNYNPANYTVNTFSTLGSTLWGSGAAIQYKEAAWLTLGMLNKSGVTQGYYSYAIWAVFAPGEVLSWLKSYNDTAACNAVFGNNCTGTAAAAGSLLYTAQQNYMNGGNYSNFLILTPQGCSSTGCPEQEFFEPMPVPEGGSALIYLLIAGIACFGAMFYSRRRTAKGGLA